MKHVLTLMKIQKNTQQWSAFSPCHKGSDFKNSDVILNCYDFCSKSLSRTLNHTALLKNPTLIMNYIMFHSEMPVCFKIRTTYHYSLFWYLRIYGHYLKN